LEHDRLKKKIDKAQKKLDDLEKKLRSICPHNLIKASYGGFVLKCEHCQLQGKAYEYEIKNGCVKFNDPNYDILKKIYNKN